MSNCVTTHEAQFERWKFLSEHRAMASDYGSFVFSDGTHCRKTIAGMMTSGKLTTIDSNSKILCLYRVLYDISRHEPSNADELVAMGDDSVQHGVVPEDFCFYLKTELGVTFTIESMLGLFEDQNFCSMDFKLIEGSFVGVPRNWSKTIYALCHPEKKKLATLGNALMSVCLEYAFHPNFRVLHHALATYFPQLNRSVSWFKSVHTGFE